MSGETVTPSRQQYLDVRAQHPDAIVFFRMGDFYETFDEDAALVARELDLVLTSRPMGKDKRVPMAGVPHHAAENTSPASLPKATRSPCANKSARNWSMA